MSNYTGNDKSLRRRHPLIWKWKQQLAYLLAILLFTYVPKCVGFPSHKNDPTYMLEISFQNDLKRASDLLSSIGIHGLCHPTSNIYSPAFPQCEELLVERQDFNAEAIRRRRLEEDYPENSEEQQGGRVDDANNEESEGLHYVINGSMTLLCVLGCALASGLTVGLMSLDPLLLVIKQRAGQTERERQQAAKLLPLVKQHHQLLVTLLLMNTIAGEALPIFLQRMVPESVAVLGSVILVLVFGEILPTSLFTGRHQIEIASRLAPMVKVIMALLFPIVYPIAKLLDRIMHDDDNESGSGDSGGTLYNRGELAALIRVQYEERLVAKQRRKHQRITSMTSIQQQLDPSDIHNTTADVRALKVGLIQHQEARQQQAHHRPIPTFDSIDGDEVTMIEGALQMKTKTAMDIYSSYHKVFCIANDMVLDDQNIFTIYASGYSRVPVYVNGDRQLVKGILMTRQLMVVKKHQQQTQQPGEEEQQSPHPAVSDLKLHVPQCVSPHTNLVNLVNLFQTGGSAVRAGHMALVCARPEIANEALEQDQVVPEEAGLMGIITLEDVLEALLQEQIYDEMDTAGRSVTMVNNDMVPIEESGSFHRLA